MDKAQSQSGSRMRLLSGGNAASAPAILFVAALLVLAMCASVWWSDVPFYRPGGSIFATLTGLAGIGGAVALLLVLYRRMHRRLAAIFAVGDALVAVSAGDRDAASLSVNPDFGPQAQAWNQIIAEIDAVRKGAVDERVRRSLERRREAPGEMDSACDVLAQGVILIDGQCRVTYANGAAAAFLGRRREELPGADLTQIIKFEQVVIALRAVNAAGNRGRQIVDAKDENGAAVLRFIIRPVRREDSGSAMVIIDDITQQRTAEEARHRFVAQATHELRTPLTNIRLYVETAIEDGENDPATRARCLNVINSETRRLERIVGEMLSVAEIDAGSFKLKCDDVRLDALFDDLKADYEQQAQDKQISLVFQRAPKLPVLHADRDKILLALHNLLSNALKYTPDGGKVELVANASEKQLTIQVKDTGFGISGVDAERIFDRFYRANDARVAKLTGTGLGLTLAREVIRLHGGDIVVESRLNEGSTFTITLPVAVGSGQ